MLLVIAPHPDDAEILAGGLIAAHVRRGCPVAVVDATRGELGSRGTVADRQREADAASAILGLSARENLGLPDGRLRGDDPDQRDAVVAAIRRHRPQVVVSFSGHARHPDHIALAELVRRALKAAALHRLVPELPAWSGARLWYAEAELPAEPGGVLVPLTVEDWRIKMAAVACYGSQLAGGTGPATSISRPEFTEWIEQRGRLWGYHAGAAYAECLHPAESMRVSDLRGV